MFGWWYPYPYRELSGGRELFALVVAVDVVLGPLITLVIFNPAKTRRHLVMDFTVIGLLQVAALAYGSKWGQTPINLSALHNQIGVTGPKFGKDGAFRSITAVACNGPCTLQCYM